MTKQSLLNYQESAQLSVSEISSRIKTLLENNLSYVKIKGEISGFKLATSGHGYFSLKDENAVIAATCWRHNLALVNFKIEEGLEVVVSGKITAYAGQSKYQISVDIIEPSGIGAFMQILKERKNKLESEGIFDNSKKKPIPFFPKTIAIITSPTGAVIKDIIHRISDRCPTRLIVWPVAVQGETSASDVSIAIDGLNKIQEDHKPDVIIIARGGGSIEDLWSFNEEIVIRSAYNSSIPIISAIGHETDYTLLDLVADKRAPTPTAAAEFATPVVTDIKYTINSLYNTLSSRMMQKTAHNIQLLESYGRVIYYPLNYINSFYQRIDELDLRLSGALPNLLRIKQVALNYFSMNRLLPTKQIKLIKMDLDHKVNALSYIEKEILSKKSQQLVFLSSMLDSLDYKRVLKRGYSMLKSEDGKFLVKTGDIKKSKIITAVMIDGEVILSTKLT